MLLLLVGTVMAETCVNVGVGGTSQDISEIIRVYDCEPPMTFAKEHECMLHRSRSSINGFKCGDYIVIADCKGGYISAEEIDYSGIKSFFKGFLIISALMLFIVLMVMLYSKFFKKKKDEEDGNYY